MSVTIADVYTHDDYVYDLRHFVGCDEKSPNEVKQTRGVIYAKEEGKEPVMVCKSFGWTPEYVCTPDMKELITSKLTAVWDKNIRIFKSHEGTIIRLWYHNDIWMTSTHRRIDAHKSYWGSQVSHGLLFEEALEQQLRAVLPPSLADNHIYEYYNTLKKDRVYTYLVPSTYENRVVCNPEYNDVFLYATGEFDSNGVLLSDVTQELIKNPLEFKFDEPSWLYGYVENVDPRESQGAVIYYGMGTPDYGLIKLTNSEYSRLSALRNNQESLPFRYLQIRMNEKLCAELNDLYPSYKYTFSEIEATLTGIVDAIWEGYQARFINNQYIILPGHIWNVVRTLHEKGNPKARSEVEEYINTLPAGKLMRMIKTSKSTSDE